MLSSLIAGFVTGETLEALQRARRAAIAYAIASALAALGAVFLLVALYVWAAARFGPIEAALGLGGILIVISVLILLIHRVASGVRVRRAAKKRSSDMARVAVATGIALLPTLLRGRATGFTLIAPALAAAAYAIYKENTRSEPDGDSDRDRYLRR